MFICNCFICFLRTLNNSRDSPILSGFMAQDIRTRATSKVDRKVISVDLHQGNTQDRAAGSVLVKLGDEARTETVTLER